MTLRLRINLIVGALTLLFVAAVMALQLRSMRDSVHEEVVAANRVAAQLLQRTAWLYASQGTSAMLDFLQGTGRIRSNDLTLYDGNGNVLYESPPSPYKAGRTAPDWFSAIVEPESQTQSIAFPAGRLEMQANASRAVLDAWDDAVPLMGVAAALLLLVNSLIFWLVGHAARPFARIVVALESLQQGRFDVLLPPLPGKEAGAIGGAFNRMVMQLQAHLETERRAMQAETQLSDSRELARWIDQHIEEERLLIARELHDELGQSVTAMRSMALSIAQRCAVRDTQSAQAARLIADESSRLYDAMHGIIPRLTPLVLDNLGLADAVNDLAERTRRTQPAVTVEAEVALGDARLDGAVALTLYRAAQEGITNALRHGRARAIWLRLEGASDAVTLTLRDDGDGLPPGGIERDGHYGLRWLRERVHGLRGRVELDGLSPRGARLLVHIPLGAFS